ncbi:hypothetical protein [Methylobacterium sp. ID0610]|uniref:hypothetical protein n=1 Tax=Methylobacterium carpenticola TaxID=3344827 RepID=UPI0036AD9F9D
MTGYLTQFVAGEYDLFLYDGKVVVIDKMISTSELRLKQPWPGPDLDGATGWVIQNSGPALNSPALVNKRVTDLINKFEAGPIKADAAGTLAQRDQYNGQPVGFIFLATSPAPWTLYTKLANTNTAADWSPGQAIYNKADSTVEAIAAAATATSARDTAVQARDTAMSSASTASAAAVTATDGASRVQGVLDRIEVAPEDFGAKNDRLADDTDAIQAAINYLRTLPTGGMLTFKKGKGYRVTKGIEAYATVRLTLRWEEGARVYVDTLGVEKVIFRFTHPTNPATRGQAVCLDRPWIGMHAGVPAGQAGPVFIELRSASDFAMNGPWFLSHYGNNTVIRFSDMFNCKMDKGIVWGGGCQRVYKQTSAKISGTFGSTALVANADVFDGNDVGKTIYAQTINGGQIFKIESVIDARNVTTTEIAYSTFTNVNLTFEGVRGTIASGSTTLTLNAPVLTQADVGRVVYVLNARDSSASGFYPGNPRRPHRATITAVDASGAVATLDRATNAGVTDQYVVFSPAVEIFIDGGGSNDIVWQNLHIEELRGTGLVVEPCQNLYLPELKLHCQNNVTNNQSSMFGGIFAGCYGYAYGDFEGTSINDLGKIYTCSTLAVLGIPHATGLANNGQAFVYGENHHTTGRVMVGDLSLAGEAATATLDRVVTMGGGSGEMYLTGTVACPRTVYPTVVRDKRRTQLSPIKLPASLTGARRMTVAEDAGTQALLGVMSPSGGAFAGYGFSGTLSAPARVGDYGTLLLLRGVGMASDGNLRDAAWITLRARTAADGKISGEIVISTADEGTAPVERLTITQAGHIFPVTNGGQDLGFSDRRFRNLNAINMRFGGGRLLTSGTGSPEGVVAAPPGSIYMREDGESNTTLYVKASGTWNTGWVAK